MNTHIQTGVNKMRQHEIDRKVEEGYCVVPVFTHSQKDYSKMVLEYRLYNGDTFYKITRYQAKKHMDNEKLRIVDRFEDILKENRDIEKQPFGRKLDMINERKRNRKKDVELDTMLKCIEDMQYTKF